MFKKITPMIMKALSPVHAGSGREIGIIDMPIQRESHTGIPKIEGSSIKGAMREWTRVMNIDGINKLYGTDENESAGLIGFSDGKLLFYPIKSLQNIFAYVTCPYLLARFGKDLQIASTGDNDRWGKFTVYIQKLVNDSYKIAQGEAIILSIEGCLSEIELDEYSFIQTECSFTKTAEDIKELYEQFFLQTNRQVVILHDQDFIEIVSLCKEIITRNRINHKTGIVENGQLFTEEYLPAESVLYTLLLENGIDSNDCEIETYLKTFDEVRYVQIGGNVNIGKGIVEMKALERGETSGKFEK